MMFERIFLEITNTCNFDCKFCTIRMMKRKKGFMDIKDAFNIIEQVSKLGKEISFHVLGEPMLHKDIFEIISIAKNHGLKTSLTTNGSILSDKLFECGLDKLIISLCSSDENIFHSRSNMDFNKYLSNITKFIRKGMDKDINIIINLNYGANRVTKIANNISIRTVKMIDWVGSQNKKTRVKYFKCFKPYQMLCILLDGDVVGCCWDYDGKMVFGNIFKDKLTDIISSDRFVRFHDSLRTHKVSEPLCGRCKSQNNPVKDFLYENYCRLKGGRIKCII